MKKIYTIPIVKISVIEAKDIIQASAITATDSQSSFAEVENVDDYLDE